MDFSALVPVLSKYGLTALGAILGAVVPPPFDLMVGPVFAAIKAALGVAPDAPPAEVAAKIEADPAAAQAALKPLDAEHQAALDQARIDEQNVENARATEIERIKTGSVLAWATPVLGIISVTGFVLMSIWLIYTGDASMRYAVFSSWQAFFATVLYYFFGSSKGSADKTGELSSIAHAAVKANAPAPARRR